MRSVVLLVRASFDRLRGKERANRMSKSPKTHRLRQASREKKEARLTTAFPDGVHRF